MIHAFALEPKLVATWGRLGEFAKVYDKFGLGTPRVLLELPAFTKWKRSVFAAAQELSLGQEDMLRITELFRIFSEHKCRRNDVDYDGQSTWLENAECEYERKEFAAIVASDNPRSHRAVLVGVQPRNNRWECARGSTSSRTPQAIAVALSAMLGNCKELHLVDPHFGPENARHRKVLEAIVEALSQHSATPYVIRVHCSAKSALQFFERSASEMAKRLPLGYTIEFARWKQKSGCDWLHKRYVLTELGGVMLGDGLDEGKAGETDDLILLPRELYERRWSQYAANDGTFECVDTPAKVCGSCIVQPPKGHGGHR